MTQEPAPKASEDPPSRLQRLQKTYGLVSDILTPQRIGVLLGLLVIGVVAIVGGWGAAGEADEELPVSPVGEPVVAAPFELTAHSARYFDELKPTFYLEEGYRYLTTSVDVTNTTSDPVPGAILADAATLDAAGLMTVDRSAGPIAVDPLVVRTADGLTQYTFQPGLTTQVVLVWRQKTSEPVPSEVTLTLAQHVLRGSALDGSVGWHDPAPVALVTLPVEPLREQ